MQLCCMFLVVFARTDACVKNSSKYTSQRSESYSVQNLKNNKKEKQKENSFQLGTFNVHSLFYPNYTSIRGFLLIRILTT